MASVKGRVSFSSNWGLTSLNWKAAHSSVHGQQKFYLMGFKTIEDTNLDGSGKRLGDGWIWSKYNLKFSKSKQNIYNKNFTQTKPKTKQQQKWEEN